jgi:hypothetical protein
VQTRHIGDELPPAGAQVQGVADKQPAGEGTGVVGEAGISQACADNADAKIIIAVSNTTRSEERRAIAASNDGLKLHPVYACFME